MTTNKSYTLLSTVKTQPVKWLWPNRIPLGELTIIDGDPGCNKSSLALDLAARVSTGREMPDGSPGLHGGVVLIQAEDSLTKTVPLRATAAGADLDRIAAVEEVSIPDGLPKIKKAVVAIKAKLIIIDPLMCFVDANANKEQAVRWALTPLRKLADRHGLAVVVVRHLNKTGGGNALYRGGGSIGITATVCSEFLVAPSPDDEHLRVLAHVKSNLGPKARSLVFEPVGADGGFRIEWRGESDYTAADLLVKPKDTARWIKTSARDATDPLFTLAAGDGVFYADEEFALVVSTEVPLFHVRQTEPARLQPRTLAYMAFEDIFLESARKDSFIVWDFENETWQTRTAYENASEYWQRGLLSTDLIRRHLNQREIVGIKGGPQTRFVALDHDFHGRDRSVYLDQAEALLGLLHGNGWHYQVAREDIEGMHYFLVFHDFLDLAQVRAVLRKALLDLDKSHPDLSRRAKAAGMKAIADLEIYPDADQGFRLPLSKGRQMLLDRPLPLQTYRKRTVQNVIGYINWLNDPQRQHMSREAVLTHLFMNLASSKTKATRETLETKIVQQEAASTVPANPTELGTLKNCCRQKITGYFTGRFNPPNCLNTVFAVSARIMFFQDVDEGSALDVLRQYARDIPDHALDCSRRLAEGDFRTIDRDIQRAVNMAYADNGGQNDVALSDNKLRKAVQCWQNAGFELADKSTWANCWARFSAIPDIEWTAEDENDIDRVLGPALSRNHFHIARNVAQGMVKMAAVKHAQENGMTYGYWGDFLGDEYGVPCGNRSKVRAILAAGLNLDLIEVHSKAVWFKDSRRGFATIYRPGQRVSSRLLLSR